MNSTNRDQNNESNAGAGKTDNSSALQKGVRKNAGFPGDSSHAAGMKSRAERQSERDSSSEDQDLSRDERSADR